MAQFSAGAALTCPQFLPSRISARVFLARTLASSPSSRAVASGAKRAARCAGERRGVFAAWACGLWVRGKDHHKNFSF